ncbi:MAG: YggT family protein [Brevinematales bacterium]|nr:YggT family protein [Brevinematales bacterium]
MIEFTSPLHIVLFVLANVLRVYQLILFVRVIFSWIVMFNPNLLGSKVYQFLFIITEPPLDFLRRYLPSRIGFFDLSVLWLFLILELLYMVLIKTITII